MALFPEAEYLERIRNTKQRMAEAEIDLLIVSDPAAVVAALTKYRNSETGKNAPGTANLIQVIANGSSSFELSSSVVEPLTGRKYEFQSHVPATGCRSLVGKFPDQRTHEVQS